MKNNLSKKINKDLEPKKISYYELLKIDDDKRYELINGIPYLMSKGKKCKVFIAPLDVKLSGEEDDKKEFNVVQPDIMVVCDKEKIKERNILGAPDLVIEILSKSTAQHDRLTKLNLYQKFGVKEYWIVSPEEKNIWVFLLNDENVYTIRAYYLDDKIKINVLKECYIDLKNFCIENNIII